MSGAILAIDQSTQGTKALLLGEKGEILAKRAKPHRQYVNGNGWVGHDVEEIWQNLCSLVRELVTESGVDAKAIQAIGISNQRETSAAWDKATGKPLGHAIVWQCARAAGLCERIAREHPKADQRSKAITGLPLSPYFPAAKWAWILENEPGARELMQEKKLALGTIDSYLIYRMTGGKVFRTDYSNASRTALLDLKSLAWSEEIAALFGIDLAALPKITPSDALYGETDFGGALPVKIPIHAALGDSHAALYGQGCHAAGLAKATYGTGSSVMMNIGERPVFSQHGLVTSLAWHIGGKAQYVLEGNINYTGAAISWLKDTLRLIEDPNETAALAAAANPADHSYFVPAFTGLGAPWWESRAEGLFTGLTRVTGKNEMVRAVLDSITLQIGDVVQAMAHDTGKALAALRVDGGPTKNAWLMQRQADVLGARVEASDAPELSALGAGYAAGIAAGIYDNSVFDAIKRQGYAPQMAEAKRADLLAGWRDAIGLVLTAAGQHQ